MSEQNGVGHRILSGIEVRPDLKPHLQYGADRDVQVNIQVPCGTVVDAPALMKEESPLANLKHAVVYKRESGEHIATGVPWERYNEMMHRLRAGFRITWGGEHTDEVTAEKLLKAALGENWRESELGGVRVGAELCVVLSAMLCEGAISPADAKAMLAYVRTIHTGETPWRKRVKLTDEELTSQKKIEDIARRLPDNELRRWAKVRTRSLALRELQRVMNSEIRRRGMERAASRLASLKNAPNPGA